MTVSGRSLRKLFRGAVSVAACAALLVVVPVSSAGTGSASTRQPQRGSRVSASAQANAPRATTPARGSTITAQAGVIAYTWDEGYTPPASTSGLEFRTQDPSATVCGHDSPAFDVVDPAGRTSRLSAPNCSTLVFGDEYLSVVWANIPSGSYPYGAYRVVVHWGGNSTEGWVDHDQWTFTYAPPPPSVTPGSTTPTTTQPPPSACQTQVTFGIGDARAACFRKSAATSVYQTTDLVKLNGLEFAPSAGSVVKIDPNSRRISSDGKVFLVLGGVPVPVGFAIDWTLPAKGKSAPVLFEVSGVKLFGLELQGRLAATMTEGASNLEVDVKLPEPLPSGGLKMTTDNAGGLRTSGAHVTVKFVKIGVFDLKDVALAYSEVGNRFDGGGTLVLPGGAALRAEVVVENGGLQTLRARYAAGKGLDLGPPTLGLVLDEASLDYVALPTKFSGTATVTVGPNFFDFPAVASLTGVLCVGACDPDPAKPPVFTARGQVNLVKAKVANLDFVFIPGQIVSLAGAVDAEVTDPVTHTKWVSGSVKLDLWYANVSNWNAEGGGTACVLQACGDGRLLISSKGIGAYFKAVGLPSVTVRQRRVDFEIRDPFFGKVIARGWYEVPERVEWHPGEVCVSAGYEWAAGKLNVGAACDVSPYRPVKPTSTFARSAGLRDAQSDAQAVSVRVVGEKRQYEVFRVEGQGAVPNVVLTGPLGRRIEGSADPNAYRIDQAMGAVVLNSASEHATYFFVPLASEGRWTVTTAEGSAPIAELATAHSLPEPEIRARVTGTGRTRNLAYTIRVNPGQRVQFIEQAPDAGGVIGKARDTSGTLRFTPANGPAGERSIAAVVTNAGGTSRVVTVASYNAPKPREVAAPSRVRATRAKTSVKITWNRVAGAVRYWVVAEVADGRHLEATTKRPKVVFPRISRKNRVVVRVTAVDPAGSLGSPTKRVVKRTR